MKNFLAFLLLLMTASAIQAQTTDDIIAKYIEAVGGRDKLAAIKSMKITAKVQQGGMEIPGLIYKKRPNMFKLEFTFQGKTQQIAFNGNDGWTIDPFQGREYAEKMDSDALKQFRYQANFDEPLMDYKKLGHKVTYVGEEDADGSPAYHLQLTTVEGDVYDYFLDKDSYLPVKMKSHVKSQDGATSDSETNMSDYKDVNGTLMAFTIENVQEYQGQKFSSFIKIDSVEANGPIDDAIFLMPK